MKKADNLRCGLLALLLGCGSGAAPNAPIQSTASNTGGPVDQIVVSSEFVCREDDPRPPQQPPKPDSGYVKVKPDSTYTDSTCTYCD